jgi:hypothetical protein
MRSHRHLRRLAGLAVPEPDQISDDVGAELNRLLATLEPAPACLLGPRFDFLAWNDPFDRIWKPGSLPERRRNLMWLYFAKGTTARRTVGWQQRPPPPASSAPLPASTPATNASPS